MNKYKSFEELKEELGDKYDRYMYDMNLELVKERERLLHIAKKMHLYIFLNTSDESKVYEELGLTDEENELLGYIGQFEVKIKGE